MALVELTLIITNHAYAQYCERVKKMDRIELHQQIKEQLRFIQRRSGDFLKLNDVWWVMQIDGDELRLITCYGQSLFDLPKAIAWAQRHDDRIKLGESNA